MVFWDVCLRHLKELCPSRLTLKLHTMKTTLQLKNLKVQSFITKSENVAAKTVKGGFTVSCTTNTFSDNAYLSDCCPVLH